MSISIDAIRTATRICGRRPVTTVRGSVIMKNRKSWYIGPVIGAISGSTGCPSAAARTPFSSRKLATYVSVMCRTPTRAAMTSPNVQITRLVTRSLPNW
jgi:hypothetical protein